MPVKQAKNFMVAGWNFIWDIPEKREVAIYKSILKNNNVIQELISLEPGGEKIVDNIKPDLPDIESVLIDGRLTLDINELPPFKWKEAINLVERLGRPLTDEEAKKFELAR